MSEFINTAEVIGDDAMCDLIIQRTVTEYKENRISKIGKAAFSGCISLAVVDVPNAVTISEEAFSDCSKLVSVNAPSAITINRNTFYGCTALEKVCFPSLVEVQSNISAWHAGSFRGCTALTTVDLPVCSTIDGYAFHECSSLTSLILRNNAVCNLVATTAFEGTPIATGTGYIYVPADLVADYQSATNWSTYAAQFRAIEEYTVDGTVTGELDTSKI